LYKEEYSKRRDYHNEKILQAARLIAPAIEDSENWIDGYNWVMEQVKHENEAVASKLEIDLAMMYMKKGKFEEAIDVLKGFEKKDTILKAMAAINLSFIYFLEGDYMQAEKHADLAIKSDRYNAKGLVNKGNCFYMAQEYGKAKELYLEAVGVEADCLEAIFNLGLVNLKLESYQEAHGAFDKLNTILPSAPEALYNIGAIYEKSEEKANLEQAAKAFELLQSKLSNEPNLCSKIAMIYDRLQDDNTSCHWQTESFRKSPVNLAVISWLGVWYVKREMYEQAIEYFNSASIVQPSEVKWKLMIASCYRRLGDLHRSLDIYQQVIICS
jgi:intraflagellar transport protein 88